MFDWLRKPAPQAKIEPKVNGSFFSTHAFDSSNRQSNTESALQAIKQSQPDASPTSAMDSSDNGFSSLKGSFNNTISDVLVSWYASQGFIGHQLAGIVAQHWLVNKACSMPAQDAVRKGYSIATVDGDEVDPELAKIIKRYDRSMGINNHLRQFVRKGRIFGIRVAMFKVESTDPDYYQKPFNIDGVTPGSYKGIVQIDPYWMSPLLDGASVSMPGSMHFYEPTSWMINGNPVHRTHLVIFRHDEPVDILKPQYLYGGVPLPQQIMERIYASERTANEAPMLVQTKRTIMWMTDMSRVTANADVAAQRIQDWSDTKDNYSIGMGDKEGDEFQHFETSLSDLDAIIMTEYQLVAAIACVPSTKLIGTSPKGFGASGEYEESSYHELLESIQHNDMSPLLERHHQLVQRSFAANLEPVELTIVWHPLDSPTAKELAETNLAKAQAGQALVESGAISSEDERRRLSTDKTSGYNDLGADDLLESDDEPSA
jgi:phage-related protein (TIGR01555 family)